MGGMRPLTHEEVDAMEETLHWGQMGLRNRCLFLLGCYSGFRITELLSLKVKQVWDGGQARRFLTVPRRHRKGKPSNHSVPLHVRAAGAIADWMGEYQKQDGYSQDAPLFPSREGGPLSRRQAITLLQDAAKDNGFENVGSHSMRKTFARSVHDIVGGDIVSTSAALGHANISTTSLYLETNGDKINEAILSQ